MYGQNRVMGAQTMASGQVTARARDSDVQGAGMDMKVGAGAISGLGAREPEVVSEMCRLEKAVEILNATVDTLTSRLSPVRSGGPSVGKDPMRDPEPALCAVASAFRTQRQRLEEIQYQLQRALNELEI